MQQDDLARSDVEVDAVQPLREAVATSGASGRVILSPTPPVECLSAVGRESPEKSIRSPLAIMAAVQVAISRRVIPLSSTAIASALICSSATMPRV